MTTEYVYVAEDPENPGTAWGIAADEGDASWKRELAKTLAGWIKQGANVLRVPREQGCDMLSKGFDVQEKARKSKQGELL